MSIQDRRKMACPINGKMCRDGIREDFPPQLVCRMWVIVKGKDPQSSQEFSDGDCAVVWMPTIGLEQSQRVAQNTATLDRMAKDVSDPLMASAALTGKLLGAIEKASGPRMIENGR